MKFSLISKIWNDIIISIWSKIISVGIIAILSSIPISIYWSKIVEFCNSYKWQILLCISLCFNIIWLITYLKSKLKNPNMKYLKSLKLEDKNYSFLLWFPINATCGTEHCIAYSSQKYYQFINSIAVKKLVKNHIITLNLGKKDNYETIQVTIKDKTFKYLDFYLNNKDIKINNFKFQTLFNSDSPQVHTVSNIYSNIFKGF